MMLSPSSRPEFSGSGSGSPSQVQQSITRRKRKALSCYDCRRRKLRCDRELPTCGRCSKAGHADTCSYDERSITPKNITSGTALLKKSYSTTHPSTEWSPALSAAHQRLTDGSENRRSTVEASQTSGTWKLHGEISPTNVEAEQRPAIRADAEDLLRFPRPLTPTETIIFRGENFKTQYYGGSNPTSLIAHVCPSWMLCGQLFVQCIVLPVYRPPNIRTCTSLRLRCLHGCCTITELLTRTVPRAAIIHEGGYYASYFSPTRSTRSKGLTG